MNRRREWFYERIFSKKWKKVGWKCKDCGHEWHCSIHARTHHKTGCPACNKSKLEKETKQSFVELEIKYEEQCYYEGPERLKTMPYDFSFVSNDKKARMEAHGGQHFNSLCTYFHVKENAFLNTVNRDNLKSYCTFSQGENFLAISDLCLGSITKIISQFCEELEKFEQLSMYFITPDYYIKLKNGIVVSNIPGEKLENERFFRIYQIFRFNAMSCLKEYRKIEPEDMVECESCKHSYIKAYFKMHKCSNVSEDTE